MYHRLEKHPQHPWVIPPPPQYPRKPCPTLPRLNKVPEYFRPVAVHRRQYPPHIFERCKRLDWYYVGLKGPLHTLPNLIFLQPSAISLCPLGSLISGKMPRVQSLPGHQHVAPGAPGVGEVSILQYNHDVPDMTVEKVDPHLRPCRRLSPTPLGGAVYCPPPEVGKSIL